MRLILAALLLAATAACSPPAAPEKETPRVDLLTYSNSWDAAEYSSFRHLLSAAVPGQRTLRLQAQTDSPGGETVAVYPLGDDGARSGGRLVFVIADLDGETVQAQAAIPASGLAVEVVVENASGRRTTGTYTLTVE